MNQTNKLNYIGTFLIIRCWSFSTTTVVEGAYAAKRNQKLSLSEQQMVESWELIFGVLFTQLIKNIILITTSGDVNRRLVTVLADFAYYMNIQLVLNAACLIYSMLAMSTIIIYWVNHRQGIEPTFLRVFDMISGQISPKDIGLTSEAQVVSLVRRADVMFKAIQVFVDRIAIIIAGLAYSVPGFQNSSIVESIIYVLPNTIWFDLCMHYCYNVFLYKTVYLYIMCSYLKMKIGSVDEVMKLSFKLRRRSLIVIIKKLYDIFEEINEYNTTYWSKYLFVFWLSFGSIGVGCLSVVLKGSLDTMMTITWSLITFYLFAVFLLVILTTASVNSVINRMYCELNLLFSHYSNESKGKQNLRFRIRTLIKVIMIWNINLFCSIMNF